jgi:hypothetical protein
MYCYYVAIKTADAFFLLIKRRSGQKKNISIPVAKELLKHTSARTVHAKVIVKPARVVV